jgi:hypothetical protein
MSTLMLLLAVVVATTVGCDEGSASQGGQATPAARVSGAYVWERLISGAAYPPSYNFPVHVASDGRFVALHPDGTWISRDGARWIRGSLPWSRLNAAYLRYVQHRGATWALGTLEGNYERFTVDPLIRRTSDYESWEIVGRSTTLPRVIFYAAASFGGSLWILGGCDEHRRETAEVWQSSDGLTWRQVRDRAPWSARAGAAAVVFRGRLYLIGGGRIDGANANDAWSTADGTTWRRETRQIAAEEAGGSPVVWRDRLWLVGANRTGRFSSAVLVTDDGHTWQAESAPWPARGGVAVWTQGESLFLTGGKYSEVVRAETVFTYYNDVWRLRPVSTPD